MTTRRLTIAPVPLALGCGALLAVAAAVHFSGGRTPPVARERDRTGARGASVAAPLAPERAEAPPAPAAAPVDGPDDPLGPAPAEDPPLDLVDGCMVATLDDLARGAERIVVARVAATRAAWDDDRSLIYTHVTLEVDQVLKGAAPSGRVTIRVLGGALPEEDLRLDVSHQPQLALGDEAIFFIDDDEGLRTQLVGSCQGVLRLIDAPGGRALQDGFGRTVVGVSDDGRLETAEGTTTPAGVVSAAVARARRVGRG